MAAKKTKNVAKKSLCISINLLPAEYRKAQKDGLGVLLPYWE